MNAPNILLVMVDQLNGTLFPDGPADWLHVPNLKKLAAKSTRFANTYSGSPLCARQSGPASGGLRSLASGWLFSLGLPAAATRVRALYAQPHGFEYSGGIPVISTGRVMLFLAQNIPAHCPTGGFAAERRGMKLPRSGPDPAQS